MHEPIRLGLGVGIRASASIPQRRFSTEILEVDPERGDLRLNAVRVAQQQITLLDRCTMPQATISLVGPHVLDSDTHGPQTSESLQRVEILVAVAPVPAARVAGDRADQPDIFVVAQRRLTQPAPSSHLLDGQCWHVNSKADLKRLKSRNGGCPKLTSPEDNEPRLREEATPLNRGSNGEWLATPSDTRS